MLLDTSALVEILRHPADEPRGREIGRRLRGETMLFSVVSAGEVVEYLLREGEGVEAPLAHMYEWGMEVPLTRDICQEGALIKVQRRAEGYRHFGLMDGFILATARAHGERLLTLDHDFEGMRGVVLV